MAALKYLFYSMCGAYLGLFGIFCLYHYCDTLAFTAGGTLDEAAASGHTGLLLVAVIKLIIDRNWIGLLLCAVALLLVFGAGHHTK